MEAMCAISMEARLGHGIFYGAARPEAINVIGKKVFIVGGGNSAGQAAMFFSNYAAEVKVLVRGKGLKLSMSQYLIDQIASKANIEVLAFAQVVLVEGEDRLERIEVRVHTPNEVEKIHCYEADALFVMLGADARARRCLPRVAEDYCCTAEAGLGCLVGNVRGVESGCQCAGVQDHADSPGNARAVTRHHATLDDGRRKGVCRNARRDSTWTPRQTPDSRSWRLLCAVSRRGWNVRGDHDGRAWTLQSGRGRSTGKGNKRRGLSWRLKRLPLLPNISDPDLIGGASNVPLGRVASLATRSALESLNTANPIRFLQDDQKCAGGGRSTLARVASSVGACL
jgi:hypothetical protein